MTKAVRITAAFAMVMSMALAPFLGKGMVVKADGPDENEETIYDTIAIDEKHFIDPIFRKFVEQYDTNQNGKMEYQERATVTKMDVASMGISHLWGIEYFPKLKELYCNDNKIGGLDLDYMKDLIFLDCSNNNLGDSNSVSGCTSLRHLDCHGNKDMTGISTEDCTDLEWVDVSDTDMGYPDLENMPELEYFNANNCSLESFDLSKCTELKNLQLAGNFLEKLDVSQLKYLQILNVSDNNLESLDLSKNPDLETLDVSNNELHSLDLRSNSIKKLYIRGVSNSTVMNPLYLPTSIRELFLDDQNYDPESIFSIKTINYSGKRANWNKVKVIDPYGALKGAAIHCLDDGTVNPPVPPVIIVEPPVYFTVNHGYYYVAPGSREAVFEKPESRKASKVVIPSQIYADGRICKVTGIRSNAFKGCGKVKTIVIGKNVRAIQKNAFKGASHVKKITIKSKNLKLRNIGKNAFAGLGKKVKTVRVKLPGKMKKTYTKILRKRGLKSKSTRKVIYQ